MGSPFEARRDVDGKPVENDERQNRMRPRDRIRILVADGQPVIRLGLSAALNAQPDFNVVGEASERGEALQMARTLAPDILLLDLGRSSIEVMRALHHSGATFAGRSIVFTTSIERTEVLALLRLGMRGLISKNAPAELIGKCIRTVRRGEVWIARHLIHDLVEALADKRADEHERPAPDFGLTTREREILQRVLEADTNKNIAEHLALSEDTVKHHLTNIFNKTGASNRLELALFAIHHRLLI